MVLEIATPYGLAMTEVVVTWSRFAAGAVVVPDHTAERSMPVPYIGMQKIPRFRRIGGFPIKIARITYAERKLATGRAVLARLTASTTYQSRVWLPALPGSALRTQL